MNDMFVIFLGVLAVVLYFSPEVLFNNVLYKVETDDNKLFRDIIANSKFIAVGCGVIAGYMYYRDQTNKSENISVQSSTQVSTQGSDLESSGIETSSDSNASTKVESNN